MDTHTLEIGRRASEATLRKHLPPEVADERSRAVAQVGQDSETTASDLLSLLAPHVCDGNHITNLARHALAADLAALWDRLRSEKWYAQFLALRLAGHSLSGAFYAAQALMGMEYSDEA